MDSMDSMDRMGEAGAALRGLLVGSIMRRDFVTIEASGQLRNALSMMRLARLRHLPVERDGALAGLLSYRLLQDIAIEQLMKSRDPNDDFDDVSVDAMMTRSPCSISPSATLDEAAGRLCELGIGCLPVVEEVEGRQRLVGLITESDLLSAAYRTHWRPGARSR
jgi:CBS domain-containing membrane protein